MIRFLRGVLTLLIAIIAGVAVWWLTTSPDSPLPDLFSNNPPVTNPNNPAPTDRPLSFMERLAGDYVFVSWDRTSRPIDLGVRVSDGTLQIDTSGNADWNIGIWDWAANPNTPSTSTSRIRCGGRVHTQSQQIEWVSGGDRNQSIDWEGRLNGLHTEIFTAFCGGQSSGTSAPFSLSLDEQSSGVVFLEMRNDEGTYRWRKN